MEDDGRLKAKAKAVTPAISRDLIGNLGRERRLATPAAVYSLTKCSRVAEVPLGSTPARDKEDNSYEWFGRRGESGKSMRV